MIRAVGAAGALVSALIHLILWFGGVKDEGVVGALFVVNVIAGVAIAVLVWIRRDWLSLFLLAGFGASTLGAFVIASTVGLFGVHTDWHGFYVWAAAVSELTCIGAAVLAARREGLLGRRSLSGLSTGP